MPTPLVRYPAVSLAKPGGKGMPDGHELAWLAHDLMGDYDEPFIQEEDTVDGDEEYQTPEDDG